LDHGEEVGGEFVVSGRDAAEVFQFREEPLDEVALAVEPLAEAWLPLPIALWRDIGRGTLVLDQLADAVGVVGLVGKDNRMRPEMVEQFVSNLPVMCLLSSQAEPDWKPLRIDDRVDLGREATPGATETMISIPLFAVAACWCARIEVLSII
jgi:hypothetical protein